MGSRLLTAVEELSKFYSGTGNNDYLSDLLSGDQGDKNMIVAAGAAGSGDIGVNSVPNDPELLREITAMILDTSDGAYFIKDFLLHHPWKSDEKKLWSGKYIQVCFEDLSLPEDGRQVLLHDSSGKVVSVSNMCSIAVTSLQDNNTAEAPGINADSGTKDPDRFKNPTLGAIVFPMLRLGPPTRNGDAISLFCNAIPAIEMSRCVPYVDMQIISKDVPVANSGGKEYLENLTLSRFLHVSGEDDQIGLGNVSKASTTVYGDESIDMLRSDPIGIDHGEHSTASPSVSSAGAELFSAPQTLVNYDGAMESGYVLDPFRPLMSFTSLDISMAGLSGTLYSSKDATLKFRLHDRSRMRDIAPLISCDQFGQTRIALEFGWKHPEANLSGDNLVGQFLGSLVDKGVYNVASTSWTITANGEVDVTVKMMCTGGDDTKAIPVITGRYIPASLIKTQIETMAAALLESASSDVSAAQSLIGQSEEDKKETKRLKRIVKNIKVDLNTLTSPGSLIERSLYMEILAAAGYGHEDSGSQSSRGDPEKLGESLKILFENSILTEKQRREKAEVRMSSYGNELSAKIASVVSKSTQDGFAPDGWASVISSNPNNTEDSNSGSDSSSTIPNEYVSFGKIAMAFIGLPLACSQRYDEVQLIFYPLNNQAGLARRYTTASFPIHCERFQTVMDTLRMKFPNLSISTFMQVMERKFFARQTYAAYGLSAQYNEIANIKSAKVATDTDKKLKSEELENAQKNLEDRLKQIYAEDGFGGSVEFIQPDISIMFEAIPSIVFDDITETGRRQDLSRYILKVHIYDDRATPYGNQMFLLQALREGVIASRVKNKKPPASGSSIQGAQSIADDAGDLVDEAADSEVIKINDGADPDMEYVTMERSAKEIKGMLKSTMPNITLGVSNSPIESISMSSNTSGNVQQSFLLTAITQNGAAPSNSASSPLDSMVVIPASPSITMLGCPLINRGVNFFVDMGTGTDVDNVYSVSTVSHSISPGSFKTSMSLLWVNQGNVTSLRSTLSKALSAISGAKLKL